MKAKELESLELGTKVYCLKTFVSSASGFTVKRGKIGKLYSKTRGYFLVRWGKENISSHLTNHDKNFFIGTREEYIASHGSPLKEIYEKKAQENENELRKLRSFYDQVTGKSPTKEENVNTNKPSVKKTKLKEMEWEDFFSTLGEENIIELSENGVSWVDEKMYNAMRDLKPSAYGIYCENNPDNLDMVMECFLNGIKTKGGVKGNELAILAITEVLADNMNI